MKKKVVKKEKTKILKNLDYKKEILLLSDKIADTFKIQLNQHQSFIDKLNCHDSKALALSFESCKKETALLIEVFLEILLNYTVDEKKYRGGAELIKSTLEAIRRKKIYDVVYNEKGVKIFSNSSLFTSYKTANAVCFNLNGGRKKGKYALVERKIK